MPRPFVSVIVTNWQGEAWLLKGLSSLQLSARRLPHPGEILVVDDASTDNSVPLIRQHFPGIRLIQNPRSLGFGAATMRGIQAARGPVIVLCNNDLIADEDFLPQLTKWFRAPAVKLPDGHTIPRNRLFGVSARTIGWWDGKPNQVRMGAVWRGGRITPCWEAPPSPSRCLFVQAGAAAYNRSHFLRLGGFSSLFEPGYWEDYELSYKAAKQGLLSIYDPAALALHVGGGSMTRRFGSDAVERIKARNHLLFEWTSLTDPAHLLSHAARLPLSVTREWLRGAKPRLTRAVLDALRDIPAVLAERVKRPQTVAGDNALLRRHRWGRPSF